MPLSNLLRTVSGTCCPFCRLKASLLSHERPECRRTYQAGWDEMEQLAAQAAGSRDFDEGHLRLTLSAVAKISYGNEDIVNQALEAGWKQGVAHSMVDGIVTQDQEPGSGSSGTESLQTRPKRLTRRPVRGEIIRATAQSRAQATVQPE